MNSLVTRDHDKCQQSAMTMDKLNIAFFKLAFEKVSDGGDLILSFKKTNKAKSLIAVTVVSVSHRLYNHMQIDSIFLHISCSTRG